jgi:hypothetical protein
MACTGVVTAMIGHFTVFGLGKKPFPAKLKEKQVLHPWTACITVDSDL